MNSSVPYSILIADDDRNWRLTVEAVLQPCGYRTVLVDNGVEAVELARKLQFHCLLFDFNMPEMTGVEALQAIRSEGFSNPCILMTGETSRIPVARSGILNIFAVLHKPVKREDLTKTVQEAIGSELKSA